LHTVIFIHSRARLRSRTVGCGLMAAITTVCHLRLCPHTPRLGSLGAWVFGPLLCCGPLCPQPFSQAQPPLGPTSRLPQQHQRRLAPPRARCVLAAHPRPSPALARHCLPLGTLRGPRRPPAQGRAPPRPAPRAAAGAAASPAAAHALHRWPIRKKRRSPPGAARR
jgi:hypothetical protein